MKPGPPPISFPLKALRGNPGHQRLRPAPQPMIEPKCPEPPPFLGAYAQDEWWLVAPELHRLSAEILSATLLNLLRASMTCVREIVSEGISVMYR
jgi:phage terminase small subunit